jgi:hypothetical protein
MSNVASKWKVLSGVERPYIVVLGLPGWQAGRPRPISRATHVRIQCLHPPPLSTSFPLHPLRPTPLHLHDCLV